MNKQRWPRGIAELAAQALIRQLEGSCVRIEIAGSIRRGVDQVGDIELLCIPSWRQTKNLFGDVVEIKSLLDERCADLVARGVLDYRPNINGVVTFGPQNILMTLRGTGIAVDIFSTSLTNWGMSMVVRTGPKDFNIRLMARFQKLGMRGHAYGGVTPGAEEIPCPTEEGVFRLLQWPYKPPEARF